MRNVSAFVAGLSLLCAAALAQAPARMTLVGAVYAGDGAAAAAKQRIERSGTYMETGIQAFAVVSKNSAGKTSVRQGQAISPLAGRILNSVCRLMGAARGAEFNQDQLAHQDFLKSPQVGFPDSAVYQFKGSLQPGTSALVTVVEERWAPEALRRMSESGIASSFSLPVAPVTAAP